MRRMRKQRGPHARRQAATGSERTRVFFGQGLGLIPSGFGILEWHLQKAT